MRLLQQAAVLLALTGAVLAQTPRASYEYRGSGCGWFSYSGQDLRVTHPPIVGKYVEFATSIPTYGVDHLQFGSIDPNFLLPGSCRLRSYGFPYFRVWIPWRTTHRFAIPNDPRLVGLTVYVQQLNTGWNGRGWEMSRGVRLKLGY